MKEADGRPSRLLEKQGYSPTSKPVVRFVPGDGGDRGDIDGGWLEQQRVPEGDEATWILLSQGVRSGTGAA